MVFAMQVDQRINCKFRLIAADLTWAKLQSGKCPPVSKRTTPHKPNAEIFSARPLNLRTGQHKNTVLAQLH